MDHGRLRTKPKYSQHQYQQNGWNEKMVKTHNAVSNFDTMIEKDGFGHEIVSLVVAKQKLQDRYSATEPAAKFHQWVSSKYPAPETVDEIDSRLLEIIENDDFLKFADDVVSHFGALAEHGNVPKPLFEQDSRYWNLIISISMCQYDKDCDSDSLKDILESRACLRDASAMPDVAYNWLSLLLPDAYAWTETPHYTVIHGEPWTCTYENCLSSVSVSWSLGEHSAVAQPPDTGGSEGTGHGTSRHMDIFVITCSNADAYNSAVARVATGSSEVHSSAGYGMGCAEIDATVLANDRTIPHYVWHVHGTTNSWNQ